MKQLLKTKVVVPVLAIGLFLTTTAFKSDFFEIAKQIEIFTTLFKELNMNYVDETNPAELMDSAIKNMLEELDPYTVFLNEQDVEAYKINNAGEYSGIGALVRSYEDRLVIVEPYKGYPADRAGLKAGDEIVTIGDISVADFKDDAAELLKGANNSSVSVSFLRQGKLQSTTVERSAIEVDAVPFYRMADDKTGYIVLSRFNSKASSQTEEALLDLKEQGAERIILDLRGNPGGLLSEAINVTNLFVPKGELIVTTKSKVAKFNQEYETRKRPVDTEIPLAILVDGQSASASEIVSGGLQDLDRAVIIGARSFGKGLVQRPLKLTYGTQLKVTISRYYTPSGRCIQALDYWNRDESGNAVRNTEFQEFKTRNGRKVTDGGGVQPDIPIDELKSNELIRALVQNHVIFDFATKYYYDHTLDNPAEFELTPAVYQEFTDHVTGSSFSFETRTEKALEKALTDREEVIFTETIENDFKTLLADIEKSKLRALDTYSDEITRQLEDEIIKRYLYREGLYEYYLEKDAAILTAREVLGQPRRYSEILQGP
ncbi:MULTISPECIES: S41 family peptidase [unclassified Robiginitalea]|uniref:S41 family peptidase n=1 Tax=Robiginitalea TaxID=252306 RepID=UPI00234A8D91|nr:MULTISPECIES: S41 family peptidase [unclassified Robiginitalea]MDC6353147.1 S41 family peptidase [Robiginitalea sp. PM2]MDC6373686.1 S41 family peptidase [Robiginitalea sp. SP8]